MTWRLVVLLALVVLPGCTESGAEAALDAIVPVDSALVDVLVDVSLAEARASLAPPARRAALSDSLRSIALSEHAMSASALARAQKRLADDPAEARATYGAVADTLAAARNR